MKFTWIFIFLLILFEINHTYAQSPQCKEWFQGNKIPYENCVPLCNTTQTDLSTFICKSECQTLCKNKSKNCTLDLNLIKKSTLPKNWPWLKDKLLDLSKSEESSLTAAIQTISPELLKKLDGIFLIDKPKDFSLIGTDSLYFENQIILFRSFFKTPDTMTKKIVHELGHHLHETLQKGKFQDYSKKYKNRKGFFFDNDSKNNTEEDFATNFEMYIFAENDLKTKIPDVYKFFKVNFKNQYNSRKCEP